MAKVLGKAKLSKKSQIVIPKTVRVFLEIGPGDIVEFILENDKVYLRKKSTNNK